MAELIDLDKALPPDKQVKLDGRTYKLPGDIPVELYLRIQQSTKDLDDSSIGELYQGILELFQTRDKSIRKLPLGMVQMITAISMIYAEPDEGKPQRARGATNGTKPRSR